MFKPPGGFFALSQLLSFYRAGRSPWWSRARRPPVGEAARRGDSDPGRHPDRRGLTRCSSEDQAPVGWLLGSSRPRCTNLLFRPTGPGVLLGTRGQHLRRTSFGETGGLVKARIPCEMIFFKNREIATPPVSGEILLHPDCQCRASLYHTVLERPPPPGRRDPASL